ncbi:hypothetical protein GCM10025865_04070 [Paraoerskovia sediminicola]|uniref:Sulfur carrier protein n=1 Tax=Paraoerskovia sediminicola TaxID=1138587 RepID=A0ABM8FZN6_9CELL|nr:hypothetical protein GCM10025865_04070 [Paraoerskovia sediminicola]
MTTPLPPTITVNGSDRPLAPSTDLAGVVADLAPGLVVDGRPRGVAVALNDAVVPSGEWRTTSSPRATGSRS